jgi:hypothetical protein
MLHQHGESLVFMSVEFVKERVIVDEEAREGAVGGSKEGAQHIGTGTSLGGIKGWNERGSNRKNAARTRVA